MPNVRLPCCEHIFYLLCSIISQFLGSSCDVIPPTSDLSWKVNAFSTYNTISAEDHCWSIRRLWMIENLLYGVALMCTFSFKDQSNVFHNEFTLTPSSPISLSSSSRSKYSSVIKTIFKRGWNWFSGRWQVDGGERRREIKELLLFCAPLSHHSLTVN